MDRKSIDDLRSAFLCAGGDQESIPIVSGAGMLDAQLRLVVWFLGFPRSKCINERLFPECE